LDNKSSSSKLVVQKKFYSLVSSRFASYLHLKVIIRKPFFLSLNPNVWLKEAFKVQKLHFSPVFCPFSCGKYPVDVTNSTYCRPVRTCRIYILEDLSPSQCLAYISNRACSILLKSCISPRMSRKSLAMRFQIGQGVVKKVILLVSGMTCSKVNSMMWSLEGEFIASLATVYTTNNPGGPTLFVMGWEELVAVSLGGKFIVIVFWLLSLVLYPSKLPHNRPSFIQQFNRPNK
jgi:hypothetical protein